MVHRQKIRDGKTLISFRNSTTQHYGNASLAEELNIFFSFVDINNKGTTTRAQPTAPDPPLTLQAHDITKVVSSMNSRRTPAELQQAQQNSWARAEKLCCPARGGIHLSLQHVSVTGCCPQMPHDCPHCSRSKRFCPAIKCFKIHTYKTLFQPSLIPTCMCTVPTDQQRTQLLFTPI